MADTRSTWGNRIEMGKSRLIYSSPYTIQHNITQRHGPSKHNHKMLWVQSESESPSATFRASHFYILRAHETQGERGSHVMNLPTIVFQASSFLCDPALYCLFGWDRCERFCSYVPSFFHRWIHLLLSSSSFYITILSWLPRFRGLLYWADCRFSGAQNSGDYARDVHTSFGITSLMKMGKYLSRHFPKTGSNLVGDRSPTLWISTTYLQMCVEGDGKSPMPVSSLWDSALNF
jgi:hypothetical protein